MATGNSDDQHSTPEPPTTQVPASSSDPGAAEPGPGVVWAQQPAAGHDPAATPEPPAGPYPAADAVPGDTIGTTGDDVGTTGDRTAFGADPGMPSDPATAGGPPPATGRRAGRIGRVVRARTTQVVAAAVIGLGVGAGGMALILHDNDPLPRTVVDEAGFRGGPDGTRPDGQSPGDGAGRGPGGGQRPGSAQNGSTDGSSGSGTGEPS